MGEKKIKQQDDELSNFQLFTLDDAARITTYHRKTLEKFRNEGVFKARKLNDGRVVTTKKWIIEFINSLADGPLEF